MVVAFTGYRPEKMPFQESKKDKRYLAFRAILSRVISRLIELGGTYFISGVARGFDTWVAEEILELRKENKEIQLECAIPFPGQADSWEKADQKRRYNILTAADKAVITSEQYNRGCFFPAIDTWSTTRMLWSVPSMGKAEGLRILSTTL